MRQYGVFIQGQDAPDDTFNSYQEAQYYAFQLQNKGLRAYVRRV